MRFLNDAILRGTWSGIVSGMYENGILPEDARLFLSRHSYNKIANAKEAGIRDGLVDAGLLRRTLFGRYVRTAMQISGMCAKDLKPAGRP